MAQKTGSSATRVILVNGTRLLHEMVRTAILHQPGLEISADIEDPIHFLQESRQIEADWVCLLLLPDEEIPAPVREHLDDKKLLVIRADGSLVQVQEPHTPLRELPALEIQEIFDVLK